MFVALSDANCQPKFIDLKVCFHYGQKVTVLTKNVHTDLFLHSKETNNSISGPETLVLVRTGLNGSFKCSPGTEMVFLSIWRCHALHFLLFSSYLWFLQPARECTRPVDLWRAILEVKFLSVITSLLIAASGAKWRGRCRDLRLRIGVSWPHLPRLHPVLRLHVIQPIQPILFNPARTTWSERTVIGEILKNLSSVEKFYLNKDFRPTLEKCSTASLEM